MCAFVFISYQASRPLGVKFQILCPQAPYVHTYVNECVALWVVSVLVAILEPLCCDRP